MDRKDIIKILRHYKNEAANKYNIRAIGIFGSVARGEAGNESDIDIVVRISEPVFFMLAGIKDDFTNTAAGMEKMDAIATLNRSEVEQVIWIN